LKDHEVTLDKVGDSLEQLRASMPSSPEMALIARTFQALSDPTRCKIILVLTRRELCVTDLAAVVEHSVSGVSHHLKGLRDIRLVKTRRDGNTIYYSVDDSHVGNLFREAIYHLDHIHRNLPDHMIASTSGNGSLSFATGERDEQ
jgi:DNA-binding transcriptional ArsR family regulator